MTDKAALRAILGGDTRAVEILIERYGAYVATVIKNITYAAGLTREDTEEVTSDVFVTLWQNADKPRSGKLKAWLGAVARNKAKNKLRELTGTLPLEDDYITTASERDNPEYETIAREEADALRTALNKMKPTDREIFTRHYYGIQTVAVIAEAMGMSESAVKQRLLRGREKLRKALKGGVLNGQTYFRFV